jgi:tRNA synthetases class II (D, K and N)
LVSISPTSCEPENSRAELDPFARVGNVSTDDPIYGFCPIAGCCGPFARRRAVRGETARPCLALTKVYAFGPTFRAENSNSSRHLVVFRMIEPEIAFADLSDNAALAEALLKDSFAGLLKEREEDLAFFDQRIEKGLITKLEGIVGSEFVHMNYG